MQLTVQVTLICSQVELRETILAVTLKAAGSKEKKEIKQNKADVHN